MKISSSIIACNWLNLKSELNKVKDKVDYIHLDIMDGNFVPNISFGPDICKMVSKGTKIPLDVHLMVKDPVEYTKRFIELKPSIISVHYETINKKKFETIRKITRENGVKLGIAINPETPYEVLLPYLEDIDVILVMSVNPGFYGQEFIPETAFKINMLKDLIKAEKLKILLEVDGGINDKTLKYVKKADIAVAAKYIFQNDNLDLAIEKLRKA